MGAYEDFDNLTEYPITDLLNHPRRQELVPELAFKSGVTTLVGKSGKGKTTLTFSLGLAIDAGAQWDGQTLEARPMMLIAGEGRDDLRPIFEAVIQENPHWKRKLKSSFWDEPIDLSDYRQAEKLSSRILKTGGPPPFLITDALNDMMGNADEDKAKDVLQVYRNVWRVVRETHCSFWLTCHTVGIPNAKEAQVSSATSPISPSISMTTTLKQEELCFLTSNVEVAPNSIISPTKSSQSACKDT